MIKVAAKMVIEFNNVSNNPKLMIVTFGMIQNKLKKMKSASLEGIRELKDKNNTQLNLNVQMMANL